MIRQLAGGIAQEIWNPLAVIKTMLFTMGKGIALGDPRHTDFDVVNAEVARMERSVQQFLDYTWPPEAVFASVSLRQIVDNALSLLVSKAERQGVQTETSVDPTVVILADRRQMEQVFVNLALNALQSMPEGGLLSVVASTEQVHVNLALNALPATTDWGCLSAPLAEVEASAAHGRGYAAAARDPAVAGVGVEVADTGRGIPDSSIDRVFEPFAVEGAEGIGLGLALVHQIVTRHGGQVSARNRPEGGATFTVTLPLVTDVHGGRQT
jgi:signal transduction histidine kinase